MGTTFFVQNLLEKKKAYFKKQLGMFWLEKMKVNVRNLEA